MARGPGLGKKKKNMKSGRRAAVPPKAGDGFVGFMEGRRFGDRNFKSLSEAFVPSHLVLRAAAHGMDSISHGDTKTQRCRNKLELLYSKKMM